MSDTKYFEDMWLGLEEELSSFDNYAPTNDFSQQSSSGLPANSLDSPNLEPQTYEQLLSQDNLPEPTNESLHSGSRQERIEAIKQLYNKTPFILYAKVEKIASNLYKKGKVKLANEILESTKKTLSKHLSYVIEDEKLYSTLSFDSKNGDDSITVKVIDKETNEVSVEEFDSLSEAMTYLKNL